MKIRCFAILSVVMLLASTPALAGDLYDNGAINGQTDAWTINFGYIVSDTFTLTANSTVTGVSFGAWLFPGDVLTSVEVSFTSEEFGGTTYFDQVVNFSQSNCFTNQFGYNVCTETGLINSNLAPGTYWMNLGNAIVPSGDPVYWDENSGVGCGGSNGNMHNCPSQPSENADGSIPSESFTIQGQGAGGTTPEPSSLLMFTAGVIGAGTMLRRKRI